MSISHFRVWKVRSPKFLIKTLSKSKGFIAIHADRAWIRKLILNFHLTIEKSKPKFKFWKWQKIEPYAAAAASSDFRSEELERVNDDVNGFQMRDPLFLNSFRVAKDLQKQ